MEIKVMELVKKCNLDINKVAAHLNINPSVITGDYIHEFGDIDDMDDFAREFGFGYFEVVTYRCFGNERSGAWFWNTLTDNWANQDSNHKEVISETTEMFTTEAEANEFLAKIELDQKESDDELEASASEDDIAEYLDYKSTFESNRNSYLGYVNGDKKKFSQMYGNGLPLTLVEWLRENK